jgi:hypothetical protein
MAAVVVLISALIASSVSAEGSDGLSASVLGSLSGPAHAVHEVSRTVKGAFGF